MDMAFHSSFDRVNGSGFGESMSDSATESAGALRPLGWAELCARLVASQDFRAARAAQGSRSVRHASFHGSAAQWLAMLHTAPSDRASPAVDCDFTGTENELAINPTLSVAGKAMSGIALVQAGGATPTASAHRTESEMSA